MYFHLRASFFVYVLEFCVQGTYMDASVHGSFQALILPVKPKWLLTIKNKFAMTDMKKL